MSFSSFFHPGQFEDSSHEDEGPWDEPEQECVLRSNWFPVWNFPSFFYSATSKYFFIISFSIRRPTHTRDWLNCGQISHWDFSKTVINYRQLHWPLFDWYEIEMSQFTITDSGHHQLHTQKPGQSWKSLKNCFRWWTRYLCWCLRLRQFYYFQRNFSKTSTLEQPNCHSFFAKKQTHNVHQLINRLCQPNETTEQCERK